MKRLLGGIIKSQSLFRVVIILKQAYVSIVTNSFNNNSILEKTAGLYSLLSWCIYSSEPSLPVPYIYAYNGLCITDNLDLLGEKYHKYRMEKVVIITHLKLIFLCLDFYFIYLFFFFLGERGSIKIKIWGEGDLCQTLRGTLPG